MPELSLVSVSGGSSLIVVSGLLLAVASLVTAQALGVWTSAVVARRLRSCGSMLSCSVACEIFPDQGSNACPLHL